MCLNSSRCCFEILELIPHPSFEVSLSKAHLRPLLHAKGNYFLIKQVHLRWRDYMLLCLAKDVLFLISMLRKHTLFKLSVHFAFKELLGGLVSHSFVKFL